MNTVQEPIRRPRSPQSQSQMLAKCLTGCVIIVRKAGSQTGDNPQLFLHTFDRLKPAGDVLSAIKEWAEPDEQRLNVAFAKKLFRTHNQLPLSGLLRVFKSIKQPNRRQAKLRLDASVAGRICHLADLINRPPTKHLTPGAPPVATPVIWPDLPDVPLAPEDTTVAHLLHNSHWWRLIQWIDGGRRNRGRNTHKPKNTSESSLAQWWATEIRNRRQTLQAQPWERDVQSYAQKSARIHRKFIEGGLTNISEQVDNIEPHLNRLCALAIPRFTPPKLPKPNRKAVDWFGKEAKGLNQFLANQLVSRTLTSPASIATWGIVCPGNTLPLGFSDASLRRIHNCNSHAETFFNRISGLNRKQLRRAFRLGEDLNRVPEYSYDAVVQSPLPTRTVRRLVKKHLTELACCGSNQSNLANRFTQLCGEDHSDYQPSTALTRITNDWIDWAQQWPASTWTSDRTETWLPILNRVERLHQIDPSVAERWQRWLAATLQSADHLSGDHSTPPHPSMVPVNRMDLRTRRSAGLLIVYRRHIGIQKGEVWPKTLRQSIQRRSRWITEQRYLEKQALAGTITEGAAKRLIHLQQSPAPKLPGQKKLRLQITETAEIAARSAATVWCANAIRRTLRGIGTPDWITEHIATATDFVQLAAELEPSTRLTLIDALGRAGQSPNGYRQIGCKNQSWIAAAESRGLRLAEWRQRPPIEIVVDWKQQEATELERLTIGLSNRPEHVLWMGKNFNSCLDLRDGCYRGSVVPNWMDANKQLLVITDSAGRMVGRKLLAISRNDKLLGYRLYLASENDLTETRETINNRVYEYCQGIADELGIPLADSGEPDRLHTTAWYDDGAIEWRPNE